MTVPKPPPRKNVALPPDVVERVDAFRKSRNISSESDALRRLIEVGLNFHESPEELFNRCTLSCKNGMQIGDIIVNILNDHPIVEELTINKISVNARLRHDFFIHFNKDNSEWSFGYFDKDEIETTTTYFPPRAETNTKDLDDEIPF